MNNNIISICAILKDEHQYLKEWIDYHLNIGVNQIYLFEDVNSKTHKDIVKDYSNVYLQSIEDFIDINNCVEKQLDTYNKFIKTYKNTVDYVFFIDIDEFVAFADDYNMNKLIEDCNKTNEVLLPWKYYGACGHIDNPNTSIVNTYNTHADIKFPDDTNWCKTMSKTFININNVDNIEFIHGNFYAPPIASWDNENLYTKCWLNHYITKSWEEWCYKLFVKGQNLAVRKPDDFFEYNPDMLPLKDELYNKDYFNIDNYIINGKVQRLI